MIDLPISEFRILGSESSLGLKLVRELLIYREHFQLLFPSVLLSFSNFSIYRCWLVLWQLEIQKVFGFGCWTYSLSAWNSSAKGVGGIVGPQTHFLYFLIFGLNKWGDFYPSRWSASQSECMHDLVRWNLTKLWTMSSFLSLISWPDYSNRLLLFAFGARVRYHVKMGNYITNINDNPLW